MKTVKFLDKRTNTVKEAYSISKKDDKYHISFSPNGKEYIYNASNIEISDNKLTHNADENRHRIYTFQQECNRCHRKTTIYTYIVFKDNIDEDVTYPWNKKRLLRNHNLLYHLEDPSIEYYGLHVLGGIEDLEMKLLDKFPGKIKMKYSKKQNCCYPMNICEHCRAKQGEYFIYRHVNKLIHSMQPIDIYSGAYL